MALQGTENLTYYVFGSGLSRKAFCRRCGLHLVNELNPLSEAQLAALSDPDRARRIRISPNLPVNARVLNGVDLAAVATRQVDGYGYLMPQYINP